jgi:hypothetical protein
MILIRKAMKNSLLFVLLIGINMTVIAQSGVTVPFNSSAGIAEYAGYDLKDRFAACIAGDSIHDYYLVDLARFESRFEKVYFMNLTFSVKELINLDPDLSRDRVLFMVVKTPSAENLVGELEKIHDQVNDTVKAWPAGRKSAWLNENDKYK